MGFLDNIEMAFASLKSNKMRALLTMLGIIIGIGSVIAIMTVGGSLSGSITNSADLLRHHQHHRVRDGQEHQLRRRQHVRPEPVLEHGQNVQPQHHGGVGSDFQ
jgi:hypothetical protein